jgi:hypothetical protein
MRKVKHWLHILLTLLTGGLWLPVYVIVIATTEMFNRGYRVGKAAGRVEKSNEYEEARKVPKSEWVTAPDPRAFNWRCVVKPIDTADSESIAEVLRNSKHATTFERFKELGDRMLSGDPLDSYEQLEYQELRKEVVR